MQNRYDYREAAREFSGEITGQKSESINKFWIFEALVVAFIGFFSIYNWSGSWVFGLFAAISGFISDSVPLTRPASPNIHHYYIQPLCLSDGILGFHHRTARH